MTVGLIDEQVVRTKVPDFAQRLFFLSGPMPMVTSLRHALRGLGVPPWHIRTDFFPGLA
jgi:ferredoxin-NADP reductase